jgi:hypothetical protein
MNKKIWTGLTLLFVPGSFVVIGLCLIYKGIKSAREYHERQRR